MSRASLTRKKIAVRRGGRTFLRSVMVRAQQTGTVLRQQAPKALGGLALMAGAALLAHHRGGIQSRASGLAKDASSWRRSSGSKLAETLIRAGGAKLAEHYGEKLGTRAGSRIGRKFGKHGREFGEVLGGALGGAAAGHVAERHTDRAAKAVAGRLRKKELFHSSRKAPR